MMKISANGPSVLSINPASGFTDGGTAVTISGNNFLPGATVEIGGLMATNVTVTNPTTIKASTPAHSVGATDVTVANPDYQQNTLSGAYRYAFGRKIVFLQANSATEKSSNSMTAPYQLAQGKGNLNLVVMGWSDTTATITSVQDSSGNSYTRAGAVIKGAKLTQTIYYAKNIKPAGAGANTVTVTFDQPANFADLRIFEYSGLNTVSPLDATAGAKGEGFTASSGKVTTKFAQELVFASNTVESKTLNPGPNFVPVLLTNFFDIAEHRITSKTGDFTPTAQLDGAVNWVMQVVTFKAAGQ